MRTRAGALHETFARSRSLFTQSPKAIGYWYNDPFDIRMGMVPDSHQVRILKVEPAVFDEWNAGREPAWGRFTDLGVPCGMPRPIRL